MLTRISKIMELSNITFAGPEYKEGFEIESLLPDNLVSILKQINGFIQFSGGLHVRGICKEPKWHSIEYALNGKSSIHALFDEVKETDIPFAQDCVADQYLLRNGEVIKLHSETGEIEALNFGLASFFAEVSGNPIEFLGLEPLMQLHNENIALNPGQVIHVYPPFCTKQASNGVSLKPVDALEAHSYLAKSSSQIGSMPDGEVIKFNVE